MQPFPWRRCARAFCFAKRQYAYIQYGEDASGGIELFDAVKRSETVHEPRRHAEHKGLVERFKAKMAMKLQEVRDNDLPAPQPKPAGKQG